jgi:hypothetical protein
MVKSGWAALRLALSIMLALSACGGAAHAQTTPTVHQAPNQTINVPANRDAGAEQLIDNAGNVIGTSANPLYATAFAGSGGASPFSNCSGTVGGTAANIAFPASGSGPAQPSNYVLLQNNSTSAQNIWVNALPNPTAAAAPPSIELVPTASIIFSVANGPIPPVISLFGSASSAAYSCWYR